jgi:hypothetical protein
MAYRTANLPVPHSQHIGRSTVSDGDYRPLTKTQQCLFDKVRTYEYVVELRHIPQNLGGGYNACIPQLGRNIFVGDGATVQEAYDNLLFSNLETFRELIVEGKTIPEPEGDTGDDPSAKR